MLGTTFTGKLESRVGISHPAIDTRDYLAISGKPEVVDKVLAKRGLKRDGYLMFLSRIAAGRGWMIWRRHGAGAVWRGSRS